MTRRDTRTSAACLVRWGCRCCACPAITTSPRPCSASSPESPSCSAVSSTWGAGVSCCSTAACRRRMRGGPPPAGLSHARAARRRLAADGGRMGRTACRWFLALGLLGSLTAHAAGPVWAVRGAHNTVYLAGSVHLLPAQDAVLPSAFDRAYADSGQLVMELDLGQLDPLQVAGWMTEHGALPAGSTLRGVLGEPRYTRVSAAAADLGLSMELLDGQSPWVVGIELADLQYLHLGFDPQQGDRKSTRLNSSHL